MLSSFYTKESVLDFLKKIALNPRLSDTMNPYDGERGSCVYYDEASHERCLVGLWFSQEVGVDDSFFQHIEGRSVGDAILVAHELYILDEGNFEDGVVKILSTAQHLADDGMTWGEAIEYSIG